MSIYRHISAERTHGAKVSLMCELLGVSRAGTTPGPVELRVIRALNDAWLLEIHAGNRQVYGSPRSTPSCA